MLGYIVQLEALGGVASPFPFETRLGPLRFLPANVLVRGVLSARR
jgi:hypothetical protein